MENTGTGFLKKLRRKLKSHQGVSVAETMVSFMVIVLMLTMIAQAMVLSGNIKFRTENVKKKNSETLKEYWEWKATGSSENGTVMSETAALIGSSPLMDIVILPGELYYFDTGRGAGIYEFRSKD